jgi:hypothetical protein
VDVTPDHFGERISIAFFERHQQPVYIIVNGNRLSHARTVHERFREVKRPADEDETIFRKHRITTHPKFI